uniref:Uncharacterized protein n=1 Tax=Candidatus Kentrum sp. TC TaxID=2126339 RepID=A0A450YN67_9GAMM|nr:MAG: hypothetical protein BECKTC1821D_GA0114238_101434 [Candidatus Kentron sp. TC]VFK42947.1 MAG: hypothetical protein BECKTC1821E_GA0114239_102226 [Candidatus Kentron sp. TC]VFK57274.1 MAG: hypothetical protein BECKTC1821F_GA0114240_101624 [Candidatus Kentron sp. TC]
MNKQVRQATLELMLLREKFTKKDLDTAFALVSDKDNAAIMEFLSAPPTKRPTRREANKKSGNGSSTELSHVVRGLKDKDPKRYELLAAFEKKIRQGTILPTLDNLRGVGFSFSKEFQTGKSRKETIPRLMAVLATRPFDDLEKRLDAVVEKARCAPEDDNSYQELAEFLINGSRSGSQYRSEPEGRRRDMENTGAMGRHGGASIDS